MKHLAGILSGNVSSRVTLDEFAAQRKRPAGVIKWPIRCCPTAFVRHETLQCQCRQRTNKVDFRPDGIFAADEGNFSLLAPPERRYLPPLFIPRNYLLDWRPSRDDYVTGADPRILVATGAFQSWTISKKPKNNDLQMKMESCETKEQSCQRDKLIAQDENNRLINRIKFLEDYVKNIETNLTNLQNYSKNVQLSFREL